MAKIPMLACARGMVTELRMPVSEKGNGPCSLKQRQPRSACISAGTGSTGQTRESSSGVPVMEKKGLVCSHCGSAAPFSRRQMANVSEKRESLWVNGHGYFLLLKV